MLFNSFTYLVFLPIVFALYWVCPALWRKVILVVASYIFYMNWNPPYGLLLFALTVVNYCFGLGIEKFQTRKKLLVTLAVIFNVGCLCFYKYTNFLVQSLFSFLGWASAAAHSSQIWQSPEINIILPLGISFFTFEFIHYTVDVYRGSKPVSNFLDFALFSAFFPSQIAGPIKRFQDFMHQVKEQIAFRAADFREGMFLIFQGLFKKIVLGDNLGLIANHGFSHLSTMGTIDTWIAVMAFGFQIYFDFSGYTDIGRGSALLFGFRVPANFNWPHLAPSLTDFWRRWHISLSTWLRDYLFIPMGGSRAGKWNVRRNLFITMLLGGLWHGASWHFVTWGAFHGVGLVICKMWQDFVSEHKTLAKLRPHPIWHWSGVAMTFYFGIFAWILFRVETVGEALDVCRHLHSWAPSGETTAMFLSSTVPISLLAYTAFVVVKHWTESSLSLPENRLHGAYDAVCQWWNGALPVRVVAYISLAIIIMGFAPGTISPFIYFQF